VVIDKLDEEWVDDGHRYRLIKALIEAVKEFNHRLPSVKIIVAIRRDLLDKVIHETKDSGFQEEKYKALYLSMRWTKEQLLGFLDMRVNKLVRRQYTKGTVGWADITVTKINKIPADEYLIDRTLYRPRDLIVFFNACMELAVDRPEITAKVVLQAESGYSQNRFRSICDEWRIDHPELEACAELLKHRPRRFTLNTIDESAVIELCLGLATKTGRAGEVTQWALAVCNNRMTVGTFRIRLATVFYKTGLVGLKLEPHLSDAWSFCHAQVVSATEVRDDCSVVVCPVFYRILGTPEDSQ
jgi:hypothetical protein